MELMKVIGGEWSAGEEGTEGVHNGGMGMYYNRC